MYSLLPAALKLFISSFILSKSTGPPRLDFQLRHAHAIANDTRTIFLDVPESLSAESYSVQTRPVLTHRSESFEAFSSARMRSLYREESDALLWKRTEVLGPNNQDRETLLTLAKMTANSYEETQTKNWYDISPEWNTSFPHGWQPDEDGFRGHVFVSSDESTVVISIKGTSVPWYGGGPTIKKDKLNDNLLFSCCCARVGPTWSTVCGCYEGGYKCDSTCLEQSLLEESLFYHVGLNLYNNVSYMYPNANIWLAGHSLGGSLASLIGQTFGTPVVAFEAVADRLPARRLHLPSPPSLHHITHVFHTADPIPLGQCTGVTSACANGGYALESQCHLGKIIKYDTVTHRGWKSSVNNHGIKFVVESLLNEDWETGDELNPGRPVPELADEDEDCQDCFKWEILIECYMMNDYELDAENFWTRFSLPIGIITRHVDLKLLGLNLAHTMKIADKIRQRDPSHNFYFFEFFPPRTDQGFQNLLPRISRLAQLKPLAISVTWGAGGSTKDRTLDLAGITQSEYGLETLLHLTCTNMMQGMVDMALNAAKDRGIQNILALRGDPPRGKEEWLPVDPRFQHGIDLVTYIRSSPQFSEHFCIGVAGYPEGHPDNNNDEEAEIEYLKAKTDAGADFIVTQLFYDVDKFLQWVQKVRAKGISVPIIPGVMPIQTYASFQRVIKLVGARIPAHVAEHLDRVKHDDQLVKDYGIQLAVQMIKKITADGTIKGVHFCTLNLEKSVQRVLELLQWTGVTPAPHNRLITESSDEGASPDLIIKPANATTTAREGLRSIPAAQSEIGSGELNNAASWDDFPNGRFGDFKSPAFGVGEQGPWGTVGITVSEHSSLSQYGAPPSSYEDLTRVFLQYLHGEISATPFSPTPLSSESSTVLSHLEALTKKTWWTVASQPAVDGISSSDEICGWGPRAGYVFQKAFVEFFCEEEDVDLIEEKIRNKGKGSVHFFASSAKGGKGAGEVRTNVPEDNRNAVTWGIFPGQEVVQTTIIERESFLTWKDEAFSIWREWASFYPPSSPEREVLDRVRSERWLVSVVHHDFKDKEALWKFLCSD